MPMRPADFVQESSPFLDVTVHSLRVLNRRNLSRYISPYPTPGQFQPHRSGALANGATPENQELCEQEHGEHYKQSLDARQSQERPHSQLVNEKTQSAASSERRGGPFSRCPFDVLQIIFKLAIELPLQYQEIQYYSGKSLAAGPATKFSGVCRWWRRVALDTPRLWTGIHYDLDDPESVRYYTEHVIPRARLQPCSVYITTLENNTAACLPHCRLQDIPAINVLEICLESSMDIERLLDSSFKPPAGTMEGLHLECLVTTIPRTTQIDLLRVTSIFPPFSLLRVDRAQNLLLMSHKGNVHITRLQFLRARKLDILSIFQCFPNLENLYIRETELEIVGRPDLHTCSSLKTLQFEKTTGTSWADHIQLPNLECINGLTEPHDELLGFISRHPSIRILKWRGDVDEDLANAAPQLKELNMMSELGSLYQLNAEGRSEPRFPLLKALIVCHSAHCITIDQFDEFVRARCLPMQHPKSLAKSSSHILSSTMFRRRKDSPRPMWYDSQLYKECRCRVTDLTCNPSYEEVYLTWSNVD